MPVNNPLTKRSFGMHPISAESQQIAEQNLALAKANFNADPSLENTIWLGRRFAYLYRFAAAFAVYEEGVERFPESHELLRHTGHRYISTRQFAKATSVLEQAARLAEDQPVTVEADGIPNAANQPTSNSHFNIWYHLGLAHYLQGQFALAAGAYERCLQFCDHHDSLVATVDWYYMTQRRQGNVEAAEALLALVPEQIELIESQSYYLRIQMYRGEISAEILLQPTDNSANARLLNLATQGYGVGNWYLYNGNVDKAQQVFEQVIATNFWSAFGYIAAETDRLAISNAPAQ